MTIKEILNLIEELEYEIECEERDLQIYGYSENHLVYIEDLMFELEELEYLLSMVTM